MLLPELQTARFEKYLTLDGLRLVFERNPRQRAPNAERARRGFEFLGPLSSGLARREQADLRAVGSGRTSVTAYWRGSRSPISRCPAHTLAGSCRALTSPDTQTGDVVSVASRVVFSATPELCFAVCLQDGDGTQLQAMISLAGVGEGRWPRPGRPTSTSATSCSCTVR